MEERKTRFENAGRPGFNDDASTLDRFAHHALNNRPNDVHDTGRHEAERRQAQQRKQEAEARAVHDRLRQGNPQDRQCAGRTNCIPSSQRNAQAQAKQQIKGNLYYTQMDVELKDHGRRYTESDETVVSKMISKEEFPLG
ncbi:hypothetical protein H8S23_02735 [Anaerofilum sp. BX8]|uniref:Uncharacterized protein n=1 Tax=Anaerofilum hominis TaxID=2763016 RepID=A0A923I5Y9_9FIRM|nr:hypothetical protein [Anaerofilum hominis]MBC5580414.1 hypothetical protein [Anaerofilum hominis]